MGKGRVIINCFGWSQLSIHAHMRNQAFLRNNTVVFSTQDVKVSVLILCRLNGLVPVLHLFMQGEKALANNRFLTLISKGERGQKERGRERELESEREKKRKMMGDRERITKRNCLRGALLSDIELEEPGDRARAQTSPPLCILSIEPHFLLSQSLLAKKPRRNNARELVIV